MNLTTETRKHRKISFNGGVVAAHIVERAATPIPTPFCDSRALRASVVYKISLFSGLDFFLNNGKVKII